MFTIVDHILYDEQNQPLYDPNQASSNIFTTVTPKYLVMHCTATGAPFDSNRRAMLSATYQASAHVLIGRDGEVAQLVRFDQGAWHAGGSVWDEVKANMNMNRYSFGIEMVNTGFLEEDEQGQFYKKGYLERFVIPEADRVKLPHPPRTGEKWWQIYPAAQLAAVEGIARALFATYPTLKDVVAHDEINPNDRWGDPGPAFPMQALHARLLNLPEHLPIRRARRTKSKADLYRRPQADPAEFLQTIPANLRIGILNDANAGWVAVHVLDPVAGQADLVGWIQVDRLHAVPEKQHYHQPENLAYPLIHFGE